VHKIVTKAAPCGQMVTSGYNWLREACATTSTYRDDHRGYDKLKMVVLQLNVRGDFGERWSTRAVMSDVNIRNLKLKKKKEGAEVSVCSNS
jgi:hypothetical protein